MFMAGCPGAGKTEFSKSIIPELQKRDPSSQVVRIDADDIRKFLPMFRGANSSEIQRAASIGVDKIFDHVVKYRQNCIMDGTFAKYEVARMNIVRSIRHDRKTGIFFIYQEPEVAWDFTKKREALEGRNIPKKAFIEAFFASKKNVNKIKSEFKNQVELHIIIKNKANEAGKSIFNAREIDKVLGSEYTIGSLENILA